MADNRKYIDLNALQIYYSECKKAQDNMLKEIVSTQDTGALNDTSKYLIVDGTVFAPMTNTDSVVDSNGTTLTDIIASFGLGGGTTEGGQTVVGATATVQPIATASAEISAPKKGLAEASDVKTYVDAKVAEAKQAGADASAKVDTAIAALNATVTSDDTAVATVKVVETNGKITDVEVTNIGAGVTHTAATKSAEANLTATTATGAVIGSDIAKIKSYVDEKSTIVSISETDIADLLK